MYTLIATAKLNNIDPQAWLADVLQRIADHPARRMHELLPWNWHAPTPSTPPRRKIAPTTALSLQRLLQIIRRQSAASAGWVLTGCGKSPASASLAQLVCIRRLYILFALCRATDFLRSLLSLVTGVISTLDAG
jgi:hypothetical protein